MIERAQISSAKTDHVDQLAERLARGDGDLAKVAPVLGHLLGNADHALFSDEVVARVRGMLAGMARELIAAEMHASDSDRDFVPDPRRTQALFRALIDHSALLAHCHAVALEWQLALRMESERALDPVLSPLVQALIASDETSTSGLGMAALAAQARFAQSQRRMELPLGELPPELFHEALQCWRGKAGPASVNALDAAEGALRAAFDSSTSRLGLLERLVVAMGKGVTAALSIEHAGVALFVSALAAASGQPRNRIILSTNESQAARLLLSLRATGLKPHSVDLQLVFLHPTVSLPPGSSAIDPDEAAAILDDAASGLPR